MTVRVTRSKLVNVDGKIVQLSPGDVVPDGVVLDPEYTTEPEPEDKAAAAQKPTRKAPAKKTTARKKSDA